MISLTDINQKIGCTDRSLNRLRMQPFALSHPEQDCVCLSSPRFMGNTAQTADFSEYSIYFPKNDKTIISEAVRLIDQAFPSYRDSEENFYDYWKYASQGELMVLMHSGKVVGAALFKISGNTLSLAQFVITKEYRKRGLGRHLMKCLQDSTRNQSIITLQVGKADTHTIEFYKACGFTLFKEDDVFYTYTWQRPA